MQPSQPPICCGTLGAWSQPVTMKPVSDFVGGSNKLEPMAERRFRQHTSESRLWNWSNLPAASAADPLFYNMRCCQTSRNAGSNTSRSSVIGTRDWSGAS
jgi:hypothetical protein